MAGYTVPSRKAMELLSTETLQRVAENLRSDIDHFEIPITLQDLHDGYGTAMELLEAREQNEGLFTMIKIKPTEFIARMSSTELDLEAKSLRSVIDKFDAEFYDELCASYAEVTQRITDLRQETEKEDWYLTVSPRFESEGTRLYGPASLSAMQEKMTEQANADSDTQYTALDLDDNYHGETAVHIMDILKLEVE